MHPAEAREERNDVAKGVAATSLIFFVCMIVPVFGVLFSLFVPAPVLLYRCKLGRRGAGLVVAGASAVFVFFAGVSFDLFYFGQLMLLGFVLGEMFEKGASVETAILFACGACCACAAAGLVFAASAAGTGIVDLISGFVSKNLELSVAYYEKLGAPPEQIALIENSLDRIGGLMVRTVPGVVVSGSLLVAWCNVLVSKRVFAAAKLQAPDLGALKRWSAPEPLVWAAISAAIMLLSNEKTFFLIGINVFLVLTTIYFFQGIAIVSCFFERKDFPPLLRWIVYGFIAMQLMMVFLVAGIGFFDTWFDFRKRTE